MFYNWIWNLETILYLVPILLINNSSYIFSKVVSVQSCYGTIGFLGGKKYKIFFLIVRQHVYEPSNKISKYDHHHFWESDC